ncbi:MAG: hypothetical protein VYB87_06010, partial [Acidobacteriota bacterium]|nr:hypothetical protein [Acidobacteriota bacterium]
MATKFTMGMIRGFLLLGVILMAACEAPSTAPPPPFTPVGDVQQLMEMVIDPAADIVWEAVGTIVTFDGTEEIFPRSDE